MYNPQPYPPKHHTKFYILMTTLVVGAILLVLFINNDSNNFGLTSFTVKDTNLGADGKAMTGSSAQDAFPNLDTQTSDPFAKDAAKSLNEVDVSLSFNSIPAVKKNAKIKAMELKFGDLNTKINVNNDKLELSNLKEVSLKIKGFVGKVDFDEQGFSLDGTARSIAVNDVSLSSKGNIKISFDRLKYQSFTIDEIELKDFDLSNGDGTLKVAQKLTYALEQDQLKMYYFNGAITVDKEAENSLTLEGVAKGIVVSGALLNFNLR